MEVNPATTPKSTGPFLPYQSVYVCQYHTLPYNSIKLVTRHVLSKVREIFTTRGAVDFLESDMRKGGSGRYYMHILDHDVHKD